MKKNLKFKLRKDPYIVTTFVLAILVVTLLIGDITKVKAIEKDENKLLCSVISMTPAWASEGKIIGYGTITSDNVSLDIVGTELIPNRVKMLYQPSCSACERQIDYFKLLGEWEKYEKEGLAIDCSKYY